MKKVIDFIKLTAIDFKTAWAYYPNVIIWMCIAILISAWL